MHNGAKERLHISTVACVFSILLNGLLILAIWERSPETKLFRIVSMFFVAFDIAFSITNVITIPTFVSIHGTFFFFPARLIGATPMNHLLFALVNYVGLSSLFIVTSRFVFRYSEICNPCLLAFLSKPWKMILLILSTLFLIAIVTLLAIVVFWPSNTLIQTLCRDYNDILKTNFCDVVVFGGSIKETLANTLALTCFILFGISLTITILIIIFCAWRINQTVSTIKMSKLSVKIHRRTLKISIVGTLIPFIFIYSPVIFNFISMIIYVDTLQFAFTLPYLFVMFPLANAISSMVFVKDYRAYMFGALFRPLIKLAGNVDKTTVVPSTKARGIII